jgi:hypothetical protein
MTAGDGMATGEGDSGGGVGSNMCLMHIAQLHIVSSRVGTFNFVEKLKVQGTSAGTITAAIGRRGRTDCLLLGFSTTADADIVDGAWRSLANSTRLTSVNDELNDSTLINFAAILRFLTGLGGDNNLQKTSKYKLQSVHSHSTGQCDHMVKFKMATERQVDCAE